MAKTFLVPIDLKQNEVRNPVAQNLASAPSGAKAGQFYYDTSSNGFYWYNGSTWVLATGANPAFGPSTATTTFGLAKSDGTSQNYARADHTHGTPTHLDSDHTAIHLSALLAPITALSIGSQRLINVADPTSPQDAATKNYVDGISAGLDFKASAAYATTAALPSNTYSNGVLTATANGVLTSQDGQTPSAGDRFLVKNESNAANNGIYTITQLGSSSVPYILTRTNDANSGTTLNAGALIYIERGTVQSGQQWIMTTTGAITIGTSAINWTQFSGASALTAGAGLVANGNIFAVGQGTGIVVGPDSVSVDFTIVTQKKTFTIGDGSTLSYVLNHNLGTRAFSTTVIPLSAPYDEQEVDVQHTDTNNVTIGFSTAPASNSFLVTLIG